MKGKTRTWPATRYASKLALVACDEGFRWEVQSHNGWLRYDDQGEPLASKWYKHKATAAARMRETHPSWWRRRVVDLTGVGVDLSSLPSDTPPAGYGKPVSAARL